MKKPHDLVDFGIFDDLPDIEPDVANDSKVLLHDHITRVRQELYVLELNDSTTQNVKEEKTSVDGWPSRLPSDGPIKKKQQGDKTKGYFDKGEVSNRSESEVPHGSRSSMEFTKENVDVVKP
ncbi:hypothetical protein Ancab_007296 [Ancistrocladus abbreviatus]